VTSFLKTFSPIPPSEIEFTKQPNNFLLKSATPTVFRPVVDLATDTNAWGQKLTAYFPDKTKYAAEQGAPSTPVVYKNLAKEMRQLTGIDAYPEQWRVFAEGTPLGWGPLGYILKSVAQSNSDMEGRKKDLIDEIPGSTMLRLVGASRLVGGTSRYLEARYHQQYDKALSDRREFNAQEAAGKGARWLQANPERARRIDALKEQETEMRSISKDYNALIRGMQAGTINLEQGRRQLESVANHREKQMRGFLRLAQQWNEEELGGPEEVE
jgi:Large polyvalent protein associated domain 38